METSVARADRISVRLGIPSVATLMSTADGSLSRAIEVHAHRRRQTLGAPLRSNQSDRQEVRTMTRPSMLPAAGVAIAFAALLSAIGTFGLLGEGSETHATREYLVVLAIVGVSAFAVFGWAVPRAMVSPAIGWTAVVLGVLAVVSVVAFWSGLPPVLATGALILGWAQRATMRGRVAVALGALALVGDVLIWIGDATSWF